MYEFYEESNNNGEVPKLLLIRSKMKVIFLFGIMLEIFSH